MTQFSSTVDFLKVDEELGLILGFAIVCTEDGEPYFDLGSVDPVTGVRTRDHIPDDAMLRKATNFMKNARVACDMHTRDAEGNVVPDGSVVFAFPLTAEIAKSLDITTQRTGLLVAVAPDNPETLAKARRGEYRGFSIGGSLGPDNEILDA